MAVGGVSAKRRAGPPGSLAAAPAGGGGAPPGGIGHGSAGALAGAAAWFWKPQRRSLAVAAVLFLLSLSALLSFHAATSSAGQGLDLELERASGLPSDLIHEELDAWDHIASKGLKGLVGKGQGGTVHGAAEGSEGASKKSAVPFSKEEFEATIHGSFRNRAERSILHIAEDNACSVPRPVQRCRMRPGERIHLVFVSAMWNREMHTKEETEHILKSILFGTKCRLHIHFMVSGEPEVSAVTAMMDSVPARHLEPVPSPLISGADPESLSPVERQGYVSDPADSPFRKPKVVFSLHYIPAEWVLERAKALDMFPLDHHAGIPGMSKFFLPEILWQVRTAIYLDVDMLVAGDIQDLQEYVGEMEQDPQLLYYMSNNHPEGHNRRRWLRPYCSCQMLLHLERMRDANMSKLFLSTLKGHKPRELAEYVSDGDQFLFMRTCKVLERVCRILPRMWNVSGCSKPIPFLGLSARGREANGSCWRVVHFNCMGHKGQSQKGRYDIPPEWEEAFHWTSQMSLRDAASHRSIT